MTIRLVCISDTHTFQDQISVPYGDIIVHAGDATFRGERHEVMDFAKWYRELPHMYKVFVAGNHDTTFEDVPARAKAWLHLEETRDDSGKKTKHRLDVDEKGNRLPLTERPIIYLEDQGVELEVDGQKIFIYGSPWQPEFCGWAFNLPRGSPLKKKWDRIPKQTDVLITHGPPYGACDTLSELSSNPGEHVGCHELRRAIQRVSPKINVCGHIHEGYGVKKIFNTLVANASTCTCKYKPTNKPIVFDIHEDGTVEQIVGD